MNCITITISAQLATTSNPYSIFAIIIKNGGVCMNANQPIIIALNMKKLAKHNLILTIVLIILLPLTNSIIHQSFSLEFTLLDIVLLSLGYILFIVLHEAFHLIGFMLFGAGLKREICSS